MSSLRGHPVLGHSILYTIIVEKREKIKSIFSKKLDSIYEKIKQLGLSSKGSKKSTFFLIGGRRKKIIKNIQPGRPSKPQWNIWTFAFLISWGTSSQRFYEQDFIQFTVFINLKFYNISSFWIFVVNKNAFKGINGIVISRKFPF